MNWRFWKSHGMDDGAQARLLHSLWLTRALESGREYPRIPVRPVVLGGFAPLMSRPHGPEHARRWWEAALERVDD